VKFKVRNGISHIVNDQESDHPSRQYPQDHGIAGEAHGLVYGERAKTYGHPRFDFTSIGTVWTGLLQDLLKDGAHIDAHRVAVLMTGLKLARLVKSPRHHDSRVDTIGYMLTMERLDEPDGELPRPEGLIEGSGVQGKMRGMPPLKTYTFPVDSGNPHSFGQKTVQAYSFREAQEKFDLWNDKRKLAEAGLGDPPEEHVTEGARGAPDSEYNPVNCETTSQSPTETVNPSDAEVEVAMDILRRRQNFHDQEATRLLGQGDGIGLGPERRG
jgi:hypothetical protein